MASCEADKRFAETFGREGGEDGAAAGHDAFLNGGLGGVQGILDAQLLLLHLGLGGSAHLDDGPAASHLGQPAFIASGIIDSRKDEVIAGLKKAGLAVAEVKEKRGWECIVCKKA